MSTPYVGEIRIFAGNFAPVGWAFCDGQQMAIAENETLYQLIGTTYGGDGVSTFNMPDMRGRAPVHWGTSAGQTYALGQKAGAETVTLTNLQLPQHAHSVLSSTTPATSNTPGATSIFADVGPAAAVAMNAYVPYNGANQVTLASASVTPAGGSQPHENMQPYLGLNFIISLYGIFPSQN